MHEIILGWRKFATFRYSSLLSKTILFKLSKKIGNCVKWIKKKSLSWYKLF